MNETNFENVSIEEVLQKFSVDVNQGLSAEEIQKRKEKFGPNVLEEKKDSLWQTFFSFFWGPIPWMIEIAAILSGTLQRWPDLGMILALLLINAGLGFFQEFKANHAMEALKKKLALTSRVLREGKWTDIPAKELVPGDIVSVKLGNILPADIKLAKGEYLSVDQSALTGESLPVDKKSNDIAYSGTIAKMGEMIGIVIATGMNTFFGKTAKLVTEAKTESHFQDAVIKIGRFLIITTLVIALTLFITAIFQLEVTHSIHETLGELFIFLLVLVIAGIPVALPAVLSMTMAIGAKCMAHLKAIVAKLISIEELAGMNILCSDKTGTLTKNEITVGEVTPFHHHETKEVLTCASLACEKEGNDVIDLAILQHVNDPSLWKEYTLQTYHAFDPVHKKSEAELIDSQGKKLIVAKGAPQVLLELTQEQEHEAVEKKVEEYASHGFRTLGVAKKEGERAWEFLGLISLFDPPREETKQLIEEMKEMHISTKMITGDHVEIAKEIGTTLGLGNKILTPKDCLKEEDHGSIQRLEEADGVAEVYPEHKFAIVKQLQKHKHVVGMTGDGVNDAPALKQADIGIAVSNATDAARAAADLILTEPGLGVITKAIKEARKIFGRMNSYAIYRITETCRLLLFLLLAMMLFQIYPLSPIMIILIALLNDIPIMMIAYDHIKVTLFPSKWRMYEILTVAIGLSIIGVISTFGLYWIARTYWALSILELRTLVFFALLCGGNLTIYLTRNKGFFLSRPLPEWKFFFATLFSQISGTVLSVYGFGTKDFVGIGWKYVGLSWIYILVWFLLSALVKWILYAILELRMRSHQTFVKQTTTTLRT